MKRTMLWTALKALGRVGDWLVNDYLLHPKRRRKVLIAMVVALAYLLAVVALERELGPASGENVPAMQTVTAICAPVPADREAYLMGRAWVDHVPQNPRDSFRLYVFQDNSVGAFVSVESFFKFNIEVFTFQVRNNVIQFGFPHSRQKHGSGYVIEDFRGRGELNLKMTIAKDPRAGGNPSTYFSQLDGPNGLPEWLRAAITGAIQKYRE
ncbi:MAG: hypothetical protein HY303_04135 [Candidatus Wallbacteria bacterium]|nr:hypothetical protein [Candidatus Wallbacteria bacterium]